MNNIDIIYKKQKDKKAENNIWKYIHKGGVWALFEKKIESMSASRLVNVKM